MHRRNQEAVSALGADRSGVVTHAEVVAAGLDPSLPSRSARAGKWVALLPGIYLPSPGPATFRQRLHAAALHGGPRSAISGFAGCAVRGVPGLEPGQAQVLVLIPHSVRRVSSGFVTVRRVRALPPCELLRREGHADLRVASLEHCVADAIRSEEQLGGARAVASHAIRHRDVDWAAVASLARQPGPGSGHLRRVVRDISDGIRSPAEGDLSDVLAAAARGGQLPPYLLNPDVYVDGVLLGSPDAWFVGLGLGDEMDSREWHGSSEQLDATLVRHDVFRRAGLLLNHTTPRRFRDSPAAHVRKLRSLVAERKALATPEPPELVVLGRGPLLPARTPWPQVEAHRWA